MHITTLAHQVAIAKLYVTVHEAQAKLYETMLANGDIDPKSGQELLESYQKLVVSAQENVAEWQAMYDAKDEELTEAEGSEL